MILHKQSTKSKQDSDCNSIDKENNDELHVKETKAQETYFD